MPGRASRGVGLYEVLKTSVSLSKDFSKYVWMVTGEAWTVMVRVGGGRCCKGNGTGQGWQD